MENGNSKIRELVKKYYGEFAGLPNGKAIVRNGVIEDALFVG